MDVTYEQIAKMIDHSLVNPTLTTVQLEAGLQLALAYDVASVSIMPFYLARCAEVLAGSDVHAGATVGFPHGSHSTAIKAAEAQAAVAAGAVELDMVANISQVLSDNWDYVRSDIAAVAAIAHGAGGKLKVIFENCYLDDDRKIPVMRNALKTSRRAPTGLKPRSAMLRAVPPWRTFR